MNKDIKKLYTASFVTPLLLLPSLFLTSGSILYAAFMLPILTLVWNLNLKKRKALSIYSKQVLLLLTVCAVLYIMLYYLSGLYFGFGKTLEYSALDLACEAVPIALCIGATERIRQLLLWAEKKRFAFAALIISVLVDSILFIERQSFFDSKALMDVLSTVVISISCGLLFNYLTKRFGAMPTVIYRLITVLYVYFIPYLPKMNDVLSKFISLTLPLVIYLFISSLYETKRNKAAKHKNTLNIIAMTLALAVVILIILLVSCQFAFGALVIGSGSMTGELDIGDVVIYHRTEDESIDVSDVIVFQRGGKRVVHRVIEKKNLDGTDRYVTKGDANGEQDPGYVTRGEIIGVVKYKIPYAGQASVWFKNILKKEP
jgi:signal peptidase